MAGATLYIIGCSARNRFRIRLRRLREPRYLIGAIAGLAYLAFTLVIRDRAYAGQTGNGNVSFMAVEPTIGAVLLAVAALASWAMPFKSALLKFSKAEIAFLFPAPLTRARLVRYRIQRSQTAVFAAALIMALAYPIGTWPARTRWLAGAWVVLMAARIFFAIVTLARSTGPGEDGPRVFGWPAVLLPLAAVASVAVPVLSATSQGTELFTFDAAARLLDSVRLAADNHVARVLLIPFMTLVRPLSAPTPTQFVVTIVPAAAVLLVLVAWLIAADARSVALADAAIERQVTTPTARARAYAARSIRWQLHPAGAPELAFVWKAMLQTFRTVDRRVLLRIALVLLWLVFASLLVTRASGPLLFGVGATWGALFAVFMLPQMLRLDLRQDLEHLELLRTWPVRGASVLRGEILWPALIVTFVAWFFGSMAMGLSLTSSSRIPSINRLAAWISFLVLCPGVVVAQFTMHNAVAVLFPGWVPIGPSRPRGVDAVGQRLVLLFGNWLGLGVALLPGIAVTVLFSRLFRPMLGPMVLPVGAFVTTIAVLVEVWFATEWLGRVYDRLDVTSVERPD